MPFFERQGCAGSASQREAMMVAAGFSPRGGSAKTGRRGATLEGLDWLFGSGVAPRRAPFLHHYSVGSSPRLPSRSRSATAQKVKYVPQSVCSQGEVKNRRQNRSRRADEAEL